MDMVIRTFSSDSSPSHLFMVTGVQGTVRSSAEIGAAGLEIHLFARLINIFSGLLFL